MRGGRLLSRRRPSTEANTYISPGWDVWSARNVAAPYHEGEYGYRPNESGVAVQYGTAPEDYATDVHRAKAIGFINEAIAAGTPFYLHIAVHAPHNPYQPAPRHATLFPTVRAPRPTAFNEADVTDKLARTFLDAVTLAAIYAFWL